MRNREVTRKMRLRKLHFCSDVWREVEDGVLSWVEVIQVLGKGRLEGQRKLADTVRQYLKTLGVGWEDVTVDRKRRRKIIANLTPTLGKIRTMDVNDDDYETDHKSIKGHTCVGLTVLVPLALSFPVPLPPPTLFHITSCSFIHHLPCYC